MNWHLRTRSTKLVVCHPAITCLHSAFTKSNKSQTTWHKSQQAAAGRTNCTAKCRTGHQPQQQQQQQQKDRQQQQFPEKCKIMTTAFAVSQRQRNAAKPLASAAAAPSAWAGLGILPGGGSCSVMSCSVRPPVACPVLQVSKLTRNYCWLNFCGA